VKTREDESYWERACNFFRNTGFAGSAGSYFIHNKNSRTVKIGIRRQVSVSVGQDYFSYTEDGQRTDATLDSDDPIFKCAEKLLRRDAPCFFIVSPDLHRRFVDNSLPQILLVQPVVEFTFSPDRSDGRISYAQDSVSEQQGAIMLRSAAEKPLSVQPDDSGEPTAFSELAAGWIPAEDDDSFLKRLASAIGVLQDYPDGKMTLTRGFERRRTTERSPFELYEQHARMNGEYACSHFFCIGKDTFSLGTTPENVLEISGRTLTVDVVAATCKSSTNDEYLAKELYENPKQVKEHTSSLSNRQNRFRPFCRDGSIRVVQDMQIKALRNVCHLHSVFTGELLPHVTIFDLMEILFPLLGARPKELLALADAEMAPHRYYGGVVGHLHHESGGCFLNIRNALLMHDVIHAKVGVGVIKESDAYSELLETRDKLSGLLEAIYFWAKSVPRAPESDFRKE
jgi:anthranilate/para-aminobenzoate synthase component I